MRAVLIDFTFFAYTISLVNALSELCDVTLLLPDHVGRQYVSRINQRVDFRSFHRYRLRYPSNLLMVHSLFKTLRQIKPQVVHQLAWDPWFNLALPFFPDVPLVTTIHDATQHPGDRESISLFYEWQSRYANQIIVHSESIKQQLIQRGSALEDKINIIPHGAYDFYVTWRQEEATEGMPTVLFFGRIWEYKGLRYLIEAEPLITQQVPEVRIIIAGHGEPFEKYEQMMINKDHFVVHNYHIPNEMVASLFQQASVVALPYIEASQSGVLAIAYAFGKPVVASAVGGLPEVVDHGQTGYLVPPGDSRALAEAIIGLLKNQTLRLEMGRKALEKSKTELSWSSIACQTLHVYEKTS